MEIKELTSDLAHHLVSRFVDWKIKHIKPDTDADPCFEIRFQDCDIKSVRFAAERNFLIINHPLQGLRIVDLEPDHFCLVQAIYHSQQAE